MAVAVVGVGVLGSVAEWRPAEVRTWLAALGLEEAPERAMAPCLTGEQLLQAEIQLPFHPFPRKDTLKAFKESYFPIICYICMIYMTYHEYRQVH